MKSEVPCKKKDCEKFAVWNLVLNYHMHGHDLNIPNIGDLYDPKLKMDVINTCMLCKHFKKFDLYKLFVPEESSNGND